MGTFNIQGAQNPPNSGWRFRYELTIPDIEPTVRNCAIMMSGLRVSLGATMAAFSLFLVSDTAPTVSGVCYSSAGTPLVYPHSISAQLIPGTNIYSINLNYSDITSGNTSGGVDAFISNGYLMASTGSTAQDCQNVIDYFDNLPITTKLVIKGQGGNAEFPAVVEADFPRLALFDGSYIPLVEDDGSDGPTLKVKLNGKVYRLKSGVSWEILFDVSFNNQLKMIAVIDSKYNIAVFNATDDTITFDSALLYRNSATRDAWTKKSEYITGPFSASNSLVSYDQKNADVQLSNTNTYENIILAQTSEADVPVEVCFSWKIGSSAQSCVLKRNRTVSIWSNYASYYGSAGDFLYHLITTNVDAHVGNKCLFKGKLRLVQLSSTPTITDFDASQVVDRQVDSACMAFALPDKSFTDYPFEAVFVDPYLANATMQGATFDMWDSIKLPTKVPDVAETKFSGSYIDAVASHDGQFNTVVTAKKNCTIIAINYAGESATAKVVSHTCGVGDTFNADMASPYSRSYPWVYLAFQSINNIPDEIAYRRHQSSSNVFGYFYNPMTNYADMQSGTYLEQDYYGNTLKKVDFDGDLLIQPMYVQVQKLDGHDSWSQNNFSGFAMVFLATNSTITVNTTSGDEVIIVDENDTVVDTQTAGSDGKATLTVPTTKLGRSYTVQSLSTGASTSISATGNMTTELVVDPVKKLTIFRNGQFSNVIDGFDISKYKLVLDGSSEYTYANVIPYLNTSWGISAKASSNAGDFTIDGNYITKSQQSTSSVSNYYYIPIKRVSGYNKLRGSIKMLTAGASNIMELGAYLSKPSDTSIPFEIVGRYQNFNYTDQNEVELCALLDLTKDADYVRVIGDIGTPVYNNLKLIKDYVHKSETPIDVIFDNGQFKSGVTTDFEFYPGKVATIQAGGTFESSGLPIYLYSKYALSLLMSDSNPYLIRDEYLKKPIYQGARSDAALGNLYIPIKRAYGYTKCKVTMGLLTDTSEPTTYVACVPGYVNDSRALTNIVDKTVYHNTNMIEYTISIATAPYVDYIILGGAHGEPAWTKIVLE